jgi:hypothetical protein
LSPNNNIRSYIYPNPSETKEKSKKEREREREKQLGRKIEKRKAVR